MRFAAAACERGAMEAGPLSAWSRGRVAYEAICTSELVLGKSEQPLSHEMAPTRRGLLGRRCGLAGQQ